MVDPEKWVTDLAIPTPPRTVLKRERIVVLTVYTFIIYFYTPSPLIMKIWDYFSLVFYVIISLDNSSLYSELFSWNRDQIKDEDTRCNCARHR